MAGEKITKGKIIRAVLDSAFEKSTGGTSLADIAAILGIKKASLYNHFLNRDDMVHATSATCGDILAKVHFIPEHLDSIAPRYTASALIKALVKRYIQLCESEPVFQIYVYIESQKFFDQQVSRIALDQKARFTGECLVLLQSLAHAKKIDAEKARAATAIWFANGLHELIIRYLQERKDILRSHPHGENSLFEPPSSKDTLRQIETLLQEFTALLQ